jgi:nitroreductase
MNVSEAARRRVSVRAFRPDPVPGMLVRELLEAAARAASGGNLQPWRVYALAGEALEGLVAAADAAGPDPAPG